MLLHWKIKKKLYVLKHDGYDSKNAIPNFFKTKK